MPQRKRAVPLTQRSVDRNYLMLLPFQGYLLLVSISQANTSFSLNFYIQRSVMAVDIELPLTSVKMEIKVVKTYRKNIITQRNIIR